MVIFLSDPIYCDPFFSVQFPGQDKMLRREGHVNDNRFCCSCSHDILCERKSLLVYTVQVQYVAEVKFCIPYMQSRS